MRDYINRLSRGKSIYEIPKLSFDKEQVSLRVTASKITEGSFTLTSSKEVKGMVYSDDERVTLISNTFKGKVWEVNFQVNAQGLAVNDEIEGNFIIESNAGEKEIPFVFRCEPKTMSSSLSEISNVLTFANLAKEYPEEAVKLFASEDFKESVLGLDEHLINVYDSLFDKENIYDSMEEFLIAAKKKSAVSLELTGNDKCVDTIEANEKFVISIIKSGWGYNSIFVYTDADFIRLSTDNLSTYDFTGDRFDFEYIIEKDKLHEGKNYARIRIETHNQTLDYSVTVLNSKNENADLRRIRQADLDITREYLNFRMKKIKKESWISRTLKIVEAVRANISDPFYDLVLAQLFLISGREEEGRWILDNLKSDVLEKINSNMELYCFYLYINTLFVRNKDYTAQVEKKVRDIFDNGHDSYRILWILFYLSADTDSNKSIRLLRIKDQFSKSKSPVMYLEAINILNSQPVLLRVLNSFEMQVLLFGKKYDLISEKLSAQIAMVAANEKEADRNLLGLLKFLYEKYQDDEILKTLVTHMVRAGLVGEQYVDIYEKAVLRELRITRLYEYYIASMNKKRDVKLPKIILMYFAYDNSLSDADKAFVYANVLKNKDSYKDVYETYKKNIEIFAYEMIRAGKIDDNLAIIYKNVVTAQMINEETKEFLMKLKFAIKVSCFDAEAEYVIVNHSEFKKKSKYKLVDGQVYVLMYNPTSAITFECEDGVVRRNINYEASKVFEGLAIPGLEEQEFTNDGVLVYKANEYHRLKEPTNKALEMYKKVKALDTISDSYRSRLNQWMIEFFSEFYVLDDFWHEYPYVDTEGLSVTSAAKLTEVLINYGMYAQAYELVGMYGYCNVEASKIIKMLDYILNNVSKEEKPDITSMTRYIFNAHVFNEPVLEYMISYFNGTNEEMYNVWKAGVSYSLRVNPLAERIIAQMLFTNMHSGRLTEVFADYYSKTPDMLIVKAYLSYNAQLYLVRQKKPNDIVFRVIEECLKDNVGLPECCLAAWVKDVSKNPNAFDKDSETIKLLQSTVNLLCSENRLYGFFKKLDGVIKLPYNMVNVTVVEHIANPDSKVTITYSINDDDEEITDVCKSNEWGIFTYRFNLFYGDRVKYYFTVSGSSENVVTEKMSFEFSEINQDSTNGRFDSINDCLASKELHDMVTLSKLMNSYAVEDYVAKQLFKPMK